MNNTLVWDKNCDLSLDFAFAHQKPDVAAYPAILDKALCDMQALEKGGLANLDEERMVGHYWLRCPDMAPNKQIADEIYKAQTDIAAFAKGVKSGEIRSGVGLCFTRVLIIGMGGSSLGAMFAAKALADTNITPKLYFIDNTDPDGIDSVLDELGDYLAETLVIVISKSGGTVETQNALFEVQQRFLTKGVDFAANAVSISQEESAQDIAAKEQGWKACFSIWDWVGGRTSLFSAVGLLPLALLGVDTDELLKGAADCDELGRREAENNPSLLLALFWYAQTKGEGGHLMTVLPYKDRLELLGKYLQQLVMESLGKDKNLNGEAVEQGLAVLGNKGSSDQHSYVQQLISGPQNAFVVFVEVLDDRCGKSPEVRRGSTSGDYLQALMLGTAKSLYDHGKSSVIITVPRVSPYYVGMLIALFERAVGFYASFVNVNAYNQPAVEFGKLAAEEIIAIKGRLLRELAKRPNGAKSAELAAAVGADEATVWHILRHLAVGGAVGLCEDRFVLGVTDDDYRENNL